MSHFTPSTPPVAAGERPEERLVLAPASPAAHWGLASLLVGGLILLGTVGMTVATLLMSTAGPRALHLDANEVYAVLIFLVVGEVLGILLGVAAIGFGIAGLVWARVRREPIALGLAGLLVGILATIGLIFITILNIAMVCSWLSR
jgi:hypothetical protein